MQSGARKNSLRYHYLFTVLSLKLQGRDAATFECRFENAGSAVAAAAQASANNRSGMCKRYRGR